MNYKLLVRTFAVLGFWATQVFIDSQDYLNQRGHSRIPRAAASSKGTSFVYISAQIRVLYFSMQMCIKFGTRAGRQQRQH